MNISTIGIIGYGKMGQLIASLLEPHFKILIFERNKNSKVSSKNFVNFDSICKSDAIIIATPTSALEGIIIKLKESTSSTTVIISISAVLEYSKDVFAKHIPNHNIILTHPLFGPKTFEINDKKLEELEIVCTNEFNSTNYQEFKNAINKSKVKVIEISATEHDKALAKNHLVPLILSHTLKDYKFPMSSTLTRSAKDLKRFLESTSYAPELIKDYIKYNRYSKKELEEFNKCLNSTLGNIK